MGAYQLGFESRSQPPLDELAVWASDQDPECTTACERASDDPQLSAGTPELSKPGSGMRLPGGGGGGAAAW